MMDLKGTLYKYYFQWCHSVFPVPDRILSKTITGLVYNTDVIMYTKDKFKIITLFSVLGIHGAFGFVKVIILFSVFGVHRALVRIPSVLQTHKTLLNDDDQSINQ